MNGQSKFPQLSRPPITEAVGEVYVTTDEAGYSAGQALFIESVRHEFSAVEPLSDWDIKVAGAQQPQVERRAPGIMCWSTPDRARALQCRTDCFRVNHVRDYQGWAALRDDVSRFWGSYRSTVRPLEVQRVGVLFLNTIQLDHADEWDELFFMGRRKSQDLGEFDHRTFCWSEIDFPGRTKAVISQARRISVADDGATPLPQAFVSVHVVAQLEESPDDATLMQRFETLREIKNRCFFGTIGERLLERFA